MSTVTNTAPFNNGFDELTLSRNAEDLTPAFAQDRHDRYLDADEIALRLAEIKSKWTASERIARRMLGRARRDRLAATVLGCKAC